MSEWRGMDLAPTGRNILGRNADGAEAVITREQVHPKVPAFFWCKATDASDPNWVRKEAFYPIAWKEV